VLLSVQSHAAEYTYAELLTKNLDEMTSVVTKQQQKVKKYIKEDDTDSAIAALKSAARYVLARPDRDENMVTKVIAPVRTQLKELNAFEKSMDEVVQKAIDGLKDDNLKVVDRATNYFVLVNFMAEFKPDLTNNPKIKPIYEKIKNAKIKLHKKVKQDLEYRGMQKNLVSPSETAAKVLDSAKQAVPKSAEDHDDLEAEYDSHRQITEYNLNS
jgi:hypothetical protein